MEKNMTKNLKEDNTQVNSDDEIKDDEEKGLGSQIKPSLFFDEELAYYC